MNRMELSPCLYCTRVADPENCENKGCKPWRNWFLNRWAAIHTYPRRQMDAAWQPVGVSIGGRIYAHPVQVADYRQSDPCAACLCSEKLCKTPCRARQNWARVGQ